MFVNKTWASNIPARFYIQIYFNPLQCEASILCLLVSGKDGQADYSQILTILLPRWLVFQTGQKPEKTNEKVC